jgi:hypothetical protein
MPHSRHWATQSGLTSGLTKSILQYRGGRIRDRGHAGERRVASGRGDRRRHRDQLAKQADLNLSFRSMPIAVIREYFAPTPLKKSGLTGAAAGIRRRHVAKRRVTSGRSDQVRSGISLVVGQCAPIKINSNEQF